MAITADIALLSPVGRSAAPAAPAAGMAFAAVLGQLAVARGPQVKINPGSVPNTLVPEDAAATRSHAPQKTAAAAAPPFPAAPSPSVASPALQTVVQAVLQIPARTAGAASSSTIQPILARVASAVSIPALAQPSVFGAVAAPSPVQPSRKDNLAATTGLAATAHTATNDPVPRLSALSSLPSFATLPSAPSASAMLVTVPTRETARATDLPADALAPQPLSVRAPHLAATVQPLAVATRLALAAPSAWQAQSLLASQPSLPVRPLARSTTLPQRTVSVLPETVTGESAPVVRIVSATATATTARTPKTTKSLNGAVAPQAQTVPVPPLATMANPALAPLATRAIEPHLPVASATATAIPAPPHHSVAVQTASLAAGTTQNDLTPVIAAVALPTPVAGPTARPDPVAPRNTAGTASPRLPALAAATRDLPSQTTPAAAAPPDDIPAARPIATPEPQPIGQQETRQAATIASIPAAHVAAATSPIATRQPATPAAASISPPQPAQTVLAPSDPSQAAFAPADASTETASPVFAAPAADAGALPAFIAESPAAEPILEPRAQTMPKSTGATAPLPAMPDAATAIAQLPPSDVDQSIATRATQPSSVATPPADTISAPAAKTSQMVATGPVSRTAPTRSSSPATTGAAAPLATALPSDPTPAPNASAPSRTPATPFGNTALPTRDTAAAPPTPAAASPSASPAPQTPLAAPTPQPDLRDAGFAPPRQPDKDTQTAAKADAGAILDTGASTATAAPASSTPAAQPAAATTPPPPAQAPPPAAQLANAAANLQVGADGTSHVTIRLDPAELGHMQIRISRATDGTTSIDVTVERPDTLTTLQNDLGHLHQALDRAGLPDQRSVTMHLAAQPDQGGSTASSANTGSGSGFTPQGGFQQGARQQHQAAGQAPAPAAAMPDSASIPLPPRPAALAGSGVNITA